MMMEPYDQIVNPLINKMSSEEEQYFNIPTNRTVIELRDILENKYKQILKIDFSKTMKIIKIFGLFLKIKKSLD